MAAVSIKFNPIGILIIVIIAVSILVYITGFPTLMGQPRHIVKTKSLLSAAIDVAEIGGREVTRIHEQHKLNTEAKEKKTDEGKLELKTDGDMASHVAMFHGLKMAFPSLQIQSEEHDTETVDLSKVTFPNMERQEVDDILGEDTPADAITVWIDPLDATQEYTEDLTHFVTTMVCVAIKGKPTIGVIHFPFTKETVWGYVGQGFSKNLKLASDIEHTPRESYKVIVSRSHTGDVEQVLKSALGEKMEMVLAGGAGYKTREVIVGNVDAYVHVTNIKKWDICSGNAIINAVNGKMTTLLNSELDYSHDATGGPVNGDGLLVAIRDHQKLQQLLEEPYNALKEKQKSIKPL